MIQDILMILIGLFLLTTGIFFSHPGWYKDPRLERHPMLGYVLTSSLLVFRKDPDRAVLTQRLDQIQFGFRIVVGAVLVFFGAVFLLTGQ